MSEAATDPQVEPVEEEPAVDEEKVLELVSALTVEELEPVIAEAGPQKLAVIEKAEKEGKDRAGVAHAIERRRAELESDDEDEDEDEEEAGWAEAPVDEAIPLILVGNWVRLTQYKGVPRQAVGRDAVVLNAPAKRAEADAHSPIPYEYQDGTEIFLVELRDTREQLQLPREAFAAFDDQEARLLAV